MRRLPTWHRLISGEHPQGSGGITSRKLALFPSRPQKDSRAMRKARLPNFLKTAVELPGGTFPTHQGLLMDAYESHWEKRSYECESSRTQGKGSD